MVTGMCVTLSIISIKVRRKYNKGRNSTQYQSNCHTYTHSECKTNPTGSLKNNTSEAGSGELHRQLKHLPLWLLWRPGWLH